MGRLLRPLGFSLGAAAILIVLAQLAIFAAAPIGGGVYHLIFAYSEGGRVGSAVYVFTVYLLTFGGLAGALLALDYPLDRRLLLTIASAAALLQWWGVVQWPDSSREFRRVALVLLTLLPVGIWAIALPVLRRQRAIRMAGSSRTRTFDSRGRAVAWSVLLLPVGCLLLVVVLFAIASS